MTNTSNVSAASASTTTIFAVGDRVEGGKPGTEDYDTGRVLAITADMATVGWDSGVRTDAPLSSLRPEA